MWLGSRKDKFHGVHNWNIETPKSKEVLYTNNNFFDI